jgi:endoglucanase
MRIAKPRVFCLLCFFVVASTWAAEEASPIRLNTIGYLPAHEKRASVAAPCTNFFLVNAEDGTRVFEGTASAVSTNSDTGEALGVLDFSSVRIPGKYRLEVPGVGKSCPFSIGEGVYQEPFYVVTLGMYLWRCGMAVSATYHGNVFSHAACHTNDAWLDVVTGEHTRRNSAGGWHDAGDYNKYVVNAGVTVGCMFRAWEDFGPRWAKAKLELPESGGKIPDFLAEVKWEIDWLLTMQFPDGSVSHKITTRGFGGFILPEFEKEDRLFTPWGSAATADFVAMTAQASRCFRPFDAVYADRCLQAAWKSYNFLLAHPEDHRPNLEGFSTGGYQTGDADDRLWAAAELWETTGKAKVLRDLEDRLRSIGCRFETMWDWGNVSNLGLLTYEFSKRPYREERLVGQIRRNLLASADGIVGARNHHGYARPLGSVYFWGCNGTVARQTINLLAANRLAPNREYVETALDALNHLFGRNCHGRSYVTGLGFAPPMHPHDRRSGSDHVEDPWPGYLVGGPNPKAQDWHDLEADYRTNEIAINWNGALIYALAAFVAGP